MSGRSLLARRPVYFMWAAMFFLVAAIVLPGGPETRGMLLIADAIAFGLCATVPLVAWARWTNGVLAAGTLALGIVALTL